MPDAIPTPYTHDALPPALPYPVSIHVRNSDLGLDESGNITRLDAASLVLSMRTKVNPGTVCFASINMRALNATARGLIRILSQQPQDDGMSIETLAEFVELSDDARGKIQRLLNGETAPPRISPIQPRVFASDQIAMQQPVFQRGGPARPDYQVTAPAEPAYFEPAPLRQQAKATRATRFWGSLGVTAYVAAFLVVVAFIPAGRAIELVVLGKVAWSLERMWYWANHVGDVKLYNNT